ncbi:MAG: hypothetical protein ACJ74Z_09970 [Bryobacteraceae bacterium]
MNRSDMAKVGATFVAGVVLTMAALTYSRTYKLTQFRKAAQTASSRIPARDEASAAPVTGAEDVKGSGTPVQVGEEASESRAPVQVPGPTVPPRAAPPDRVSNAGAEAPHTTRPGVSNTISPAIPDMATEPKSVSSEGEQPSKAETTPQRQEARVLTLQPGTNLAIRLEESLSTERNRGGETFRARLDSPLIVNGVVLADRGARVLGRVEKIKRVHLLRGKSGLRLRLTEIAMRDGRLVRIETNLWEEKGRHNSLGATPKVAMGAVVGALTGAAKSAGFVSDESGTRNSTRNGAHKSRLLVTTGARLTFRIVRPVTVIESLN